MPTPIVMPEAGESVVSGVLSAWVKADGDWVERDDPVAEVETDKITVEVLAPAAGVLRRGAGEGDEIQIGSPIGEVDESGEKPAASAAPAKAQAGGTGTAKAEPEPPAKARPAPPPTGASAVPAGTKAAGTNQPGPGVSPTPVSAEPANGDVRATPLARKLAEDNRVDLSRIQGTGVGGRIREQDVVAFMQSGSPAAAAPAAERAPAAREEARPAASRAAGPRGVTLERMSPLRQKVAARLVEAQHTAAMLTTFNECDMGAVMALRSRHKEAFAAKHGIGLGFMSFFVKAVVGALHRFPRVNAYIVNDADGKPAIQSHDYQDVAIAVASPKGLVVPVIRDAQSLSFAEIEQAIKDYGTRAKDGKLSLEEMTGGTFTITNGGVFGSLLSTPILNPPQSAILGMHAIKKRPVEHPEGSGQVAIRPMMYLALSYDHRIVDGAEAVQFLVAIKDAIEDPARLMLGL